MERTEEQYLNGAPLPPKHRGTVKIDNHTLLNAPSTGVSTGVCSGVCLRLTAIRPSLRGFDGDGAAGRFIGIKQVGAVRLLAVARGYFIRFSGNPAASTSSSPARRVTAPSTAVFRQGVAPVLS
ncbi:MAG: hypothetical protein LBB61_00435 [Treponema sp.]|nr:hypothetical protein [Treponema sp.]